MSNKDSWWNDLDRKTPDSSTTAPCQSYLQSHLEADQEELAKEMANFA
jgi:hypothetical protein